MDSDLLLHNDNDLRVLDRHRIAAASSLTPSLSAKLMRLSRLSVAYEWSVDRGRAVLGE